MRIAVIIACHGRQHKTLLCLKALFDQEFSKLFFDDLNLEVFLLDDCSTDGTAEAVQSVYPTVMLVYGNGSLFWNGGMNKAWREALKQKPNYYLWLNDDTFLYPDAIDKLLKTSLLILDKTKKEAIVVGSTQDPKTHKLTYGGVNHRNHWHPLDFCNIEPIAEAIECETMNGNCVLIPSTVVDKVGILDSRFTHALGDYDYGLKARKYGYAIYIAPGYIGTCTLNQLQGSWQDEKLPFIDRIRVMMQPKGLPWREWGYFAYRHGGPLWLIFFVLPYLKIFFISVLNLRRDTSAE